MKRTAASKFDSSDEFYQHRSWLNIWLETLNPYHLVFWSRIDETNTLILMSHFEAAGFVTRYRNRSSYRVRPTYYSEIKMYVCKPKPLVIGAKKAKPVQNTLNFRESCHRIWTSMRILQTFSIGQLQICSDVHEDVARTFVAQLYQLNYIQLRFFSYGYNFEGNEDIYQLINNTGPKAPFLCGDGRLYDLNNDCIYLND
jgi:hypothetical protein